ncbi:hypothetical protein WJX75_002535 [Coccomyxa subellipsoidea]|uniref:CCHC-type domain-containing protein n=1 Tax=Coccomyxa subellipsoidea TaxID=248742 RepID=A0ABR2YKL6_9CHLO
MHQIIERLDCQPALAPRNPWGFGSFGPSSSRIPGSKPSGALRGNSAPQPAITLEAEPTPSPLKDPRLGVNRSAPIQKSRAKPGSKPSYVPTPVYSPGTLENQYLKDNELCFHCLRKGHTTRFCPVKHHDQKPATKLVLPADYQPDKTPSGGQ